MESKLDQAKAQLYYQLILKTPNSMTSNEVDLLMLLSKEKAVQNLLR